MKNRGHSYGLNLHRMPFSFRPEEVFSCDVPNLSTSVYFLMNDVFDVNSLPKGKLPEGVVVDSLKEYALKNPDFIEKYYAKLAATDKDGIAALKYNARTRRLGCLCTKEHKGRKKQYK